MFSSISLMPLLLRQRGAGSMQFKTKQERNRSRERRRRNITFLNLLLKKRFILDLIKTLLMTTGHDITNAKSTISKRKEEKKERKERKKRKKRKYGTENTDQYGAHFLVC